MAQEEQSTGPFVSSRDDLVRQAVALVITSDNLKQVRRQNPLAGGQRRERTAEHCWHVAFAAVCFHSFAAEQVDLGRALQLAIIHDIPELRAGDTFVYGNGADSRRERELRAMARLLEPYPAQLRGPVEAAWTEYEYEMTPEGRYVMAVDVLLPIFLNNRAGVESSWVRHQVSAHAVRERVRKVQAALPPVAALALEAIGQSVEQGILGR